MKRYEKYKPTGIQWLPEIPEHWNIESFGKHFSFGKGLPITKADLTKEGIAVISYGQVHSKLNLGVTLSDSLIRYVSNRWLDTNPQNLLRKCDFVFADTSDDIAGAGNYAFNDYSKPLFAGYHIVIARPTMVENSRYWAYLFQSNCWKSQVQSLVNGVKVYSINKSILKKTAILIPSIAEQEKIVAHLDKRITLIENCKCQRERVTNSQRIKASRNRLRSHARSQPRCPDEGQRYFLAASNPHELVSDKAKACLIQIR